MQFNNTTSAFVTLMYKDHAAMGCLLHSQRWRAGLNRQFPFDNNQAKQIQILNMKKEKHEKPFLQYKKPVKQHSTLNQQSNTYCPKNITERKKILRVTVNTAIANNYNLCTPKKFLN